MTQSLFRPAWFSLVWFVSAIWFATGNAARADDLARQAHSLLRTRCLACHGDDSKDIKGKFDLRSRATALAGGESGVAAIVAGKPDDSPLVAAVQRRDSTTAMPPKENDRLSKAEVDLLRRWIAAGAPWLDNNAPPAKVVSEAPGQVRVSTTAGRSPDWNQREYSADEVWAFLPVRAAAVPQVTVAGIAVTHPIDAFLLQRLQEKGVHDFAPRATSRELTRRAAMDLLGLPAATADVSSSETPIDFVRHVDRLLESPHYGEQMARHWLDVARYADTSGFANDFERPSAWRFRDYVVRSFNADKPFDQFVIEQLAGDELDPANPELVIAAGFLRMGPWEQTGMSVAAITRQQFLDDVVNHVGVVFLGQPLRCAACHDHKFDPIPTKDYYRLQAVFAATHFTERPLDFLPQENTASCDGAHQQTLRRIADTERLKTQLKKRVDDAIANLLKSKNVKRVEDLPADQRPKKEHFGLTESELTLRKVYQKRTDYQNRELRRYQPWVFTVYTGSPNAYGSNNLANPPPPSTNEIVAPPVYVLTGGSLETPAEAVSPGVLSAVFGSNDEQRATAWNQIPSSAAGRRLALARWIASRDNTLTARVIVNRVWQWHFGRGLVETSSNFGKMGSRPSHPELLDWLSHWFVENGWSLKKLHRLIMSSAAYQQSTESPHAALLEQLDAKNQLLGRFSPRRMAAEELRDAMLAVSGELNVEAGGPGVFPEIAWEDALQPRQIMGAVAPAYQPSRTPGERNRRTLYTFKYRTLPDPLLATFNKPGSELSCDRRDETTVAPQALALFNGEFAQDRSLALAARLRKEHDSPTARIDAAFQRVLLRLPTADERDAALDHLRRREADHTAREPRRVDPPRFVQRGIIEELTGKEVRWQEELDFVRDYVPDLKPWDVTADVRALADLCLVLLNSNEFVYVR